MAMSSSAFTGSPLRSLSEASIPAMPSHATARAGSPRPAAATKVPPARHAKAAGQPHACASPSTAGKSQRACRRNLARLDEPSHSPSFTTGPSTATLDTANSVSKEIGSDSTLCSGSTCDHHHCVGGGLVGPIWRIPRAPREQARSSPADGFAPRLGHGAILFERIGVSGFYATSEPSSRPFEKIARGPGNSWPGQTNPYWI